MAYTAPYTLPAPRFYLDKAAAQEFEANNGFEIIMAQKVNASSGAAFDAWLQHIWLTGSGAKEVTPGEGRGYLNHTRLIPLLTLEEQIQSVGVPSENDDNNAVASVMYKVTKPGLFPLSDHIAVVRFIQDHSQETPQTEIVWTIKLTFSPEGTKLIPVSSDVAPYLQKAVTGALAGLAMTIDEAKTVA